MIEVFTEYPPYHDISHNEDVATHICLDTEPQNRPTAKELANRLNQFFNDLKDKRTELSKQIKNIKDINKSFLTYNQVKYQTHPQAIYTSQLLNFSKLPKPANQPSQRIEVPNGK
ncbi:hypothetical protein C2G38_2202495 [Gigaspora rosea]|uniref:Protein kinase domain-containing protein n=1 Tax=Gigaspora rosea TaxID=44941 RepID=A0A397UW95_9GLOM|nr:hypothetical protein C2G38_2202495 [Gigaspora rosea]